MDRTTGPAGTGDALKLPDEAASALAKSGASTASPPPPPPRLPTPLSAAQREACLSLAFRALKLTLDAKGKLTPEQLAALASAVDAVVSVGCPAYPSAVAAWLRNKRELGNRLIPSAIVAVCAHRAATRPYLRQAAKLVVKLPTDLTELIAQFDACAPASGAEVHRPAVMKKIAKDVLEGLPAFQAAKYSATSRLKRTKKQLRDVTAQLEEAQNATEPTRRASADASKEVRIKQLEKRKAELESKQKKLRAGDLKPLVRQTHAAKNRDVTLSILQKRYPETEEDFIQSGLSGSFDPEKAGTRMRLPIPATWDRELSEKGNVPTTWAALLKAKDERGHYTLPYMALLRNLRNILLMGLKPSFLRAHVLSRLPDKRQIQGSGQTAMSLSHTWSMLEKEFGEKELAEMHSKSAAAILDILAYKLLLRKIRGPILGTSDTHVGIIGEFLGAPIWEPCGLRRKNDCFLIQNTISLRDGKVLEEPEDMFCGKGKGKGKGSGNGTARLTPDKWLPVALHPPTLEFMAEMKAAFDAAIQTAASCAVQPLRFAGPGPVILWMDLSNPPLAACPEEDPEPAAPESAVLATPATGADGAGQASTLSCDPDASKDTAAPDDAAKQVSAPAQDESVVTEAAAPKADMRFAGLGRQPGMIDVAPGQEIELAEITTHAQLCLELRYFCGTYIDYNITAYDASGMSKWSATWSNTEISNSKDVKCCVHCRDIGGNPDIHTPALRTVHLDMNSFDDDVFALMVTSQNYTETRPTAVSVALRECHNGGAQSLHGDHEPHDCKGRVLLAADITGSLREGGTVVYACLYRENNDPESWLFQNTLNHSLAAETHVASEVEAAAGAIFRQMFRDAALLSTMDANQCGYVRLCQLYQAVQAPDADVRILLSGVKKKAKDPEVVEIKLTGQYVDDLSAVRDARKLFSGRAVDANLALALVLDHSGCSGDKGPSAIIRVANNSLTPASQLQDCRAKCGQVMPYATIDARGHMFDSFRSLPDLPKTVYVPGQAESCVALLRNIILAAVDPASEGVSGPELFVRYVDGFLPRGEPAPDGDGTED